MNLFNNQQIQEIETLKTFIKKSTSWREFCHDFNIKTDKFHSHVNLKFYDEKIHSKIRSFLDEIPKTEGENEAQIYEKIINNLVSTTTEKVEYNKQPFSLEGIFKVLLSLKFHTLYFSCRFPSSFEDGNFYLIFGEENRKHPSCLFVPPQNNIQTQSSCLISKLDSILPLEVEFVLVGVVLSTELMVAMGTISSRKITGIKIKNKIKVRFSEVEIQEIKLFNDIRESTFSLSKFSKKFSLKRKKVSDHCHLHRNYNHVHQTIIFYLTEREKLIETHDETEIFNLITTL
jgi:hypothetical protein